MLRTAAGVLWSGRSIACSELHQKRRWRRGRRRRSGHWGERRASAGCCGVRCERTGIRSARRRGRPHDPMPPAWRRSTVAGRRVVQHPQEVLVDVRGSRSAERLIRQRIRLGVCARERREAQPARGCRTASVARRSAAMRSSTRVASATAPRAGRACGSSRTWPRVEPMQLVRRKRGHLCRRSRPNSWAIGQLRRDDAERVELIAAQLRERRVGRRPGAASR